MGDGASEMLLEALRAFLRRRLRRRLCKGSTWTGGTLGFIVADCAFSSEPYAWMVHALASFLDDAPSTPKCPRMGNWISQAFGVLTQSARRPNDEDASEANWIATAFHALAVPGGIGSPRPVQREDDRSNWITSAFAALSGALVLEVAEAPPEGWISDALVAATREAGM
ncbi:unnamed protein product [Durusdinium trenchii]|uniref:Uncharacterized protein n=2 Tax=Durusdinium trenchii TaxID=1381693 RepID=A0ABP0NU62_9DINO